MALHGDSALTGLNALIVHGLVFNVTPACTVIGSGVNIHSADVCSRTNSV